MVRQQNANVPPEVLSRWIHSPNTPCVHTTSRRNGQIVCVVSPIDLKDVLHYLVRFDDGTFNLPETDLIVVTDDVTPNPVDLLLDYTFSSPERKQRRDRLVQQLAEVEHATLGLAELVSARVTLHAHQAEVVVRVLADPVCRFMLADEVGLGKTIEACLILSALHNENRELSTLILAPGTLLRQWQTELYYKFNLRFMRVTQSDRAQAWEGKAGILVAYEDLESSEPIWQAVQDRTWGLLIADEAHNLRRRPLLSKRVRRLSRAAQRALILTATPVQRRATEYLDLLRLMHPVHYSAVDLPRFARMLQMQTKLRDTINYLGRGLEPGDFDADEFVHEMQRVAAELDDPVLPELLARVQSVGTDGGLAAAREALSYVSDNYRIESRVIRNRRANLAGDILPVRQLNADYMYTPLPLEHSAMECLHDYVSACLRANAEETTTVEYCRVLFHAAASSPRALLPLLEARKKQRTAARTRQDADPMLKHFADLCQHIPEFVDEAPRLEDLIWHVKCWDGVMAGMLESASRQVTVYDKPYRLAQVIRAVLKLVRRQNAKILVFSSFLPTLDVLRKHLEALFGIDAVAEFSARLNSDMLQTEADWFQKSETCHVLLTDETGGEGRNFQVADAIIHVDLPWTPAQIEQRIGRVDRLGRSGRVLSIVPIAHGTVEEDLFNLWHKGYGIFEHSMSGLEIALEEVQDHVLRAFAQSTRHGLADTLPWLIDQAKSLRSAVEEECYFEEGAINWRQRSQFERISERFHDGEWLRKDVLDWAKLGQKASHYDAQTKVTLIGPPDVDLAAMAKLDEKHQRQPTPSLTTNDAKKVLIGTFHRGVAVVREDLTFFTLGQKHIDKIMDSALHDTRGRCCAIQGNAPNLQADWRGFEFYYRLTVDPGPLYFAGLPSSYLSRIQGYMPEATLRILVDIDGSAVADNSPVRRWIEQLTGSEQQLNLGGDRRHRLQTEEFKRRYPPAEWQKIVAQAAAVAEREVERHLRAGRMERMDAATRELERSAAGQKAAYRWLYREANSTRDAEFRQIEEANIALLRGLEQPRWQMESISFWLLKTGVPCGR
jgi:superfamily II DNA or RNA helicase